VHNRVDHHVGQKSGENGFRVWFDDPHDNYVECSCGWRPDLGEHYRVDRPISFAERVRRGRPRSA
jgi:hypothetical protein